MKDHKQYLESGLLTEITGYVAEDISKLITITNQGIIENIFGLVKSIPHLSNLNLFAKLANAKELDIDPRKEDLEARIRDKVFRRRTAEKTAGLP